MTHWRKTAITISGSGWIGTGMLGLDFDNPLELRCNASLGISGRTAADRVFTIPGEVRPDASPWGLALVGREWVRTDVSSAGQVVTVSEIPGAQLYRVSGGRCSTSSRPSLLRRLILRTTAGPGKLSLRKSDAQRWTAQ